VGEKKLDVTVEMVDARGGDVWATFGFGENERALKDGLGVECEAFGGPVGVDSVHLDGFGDVGFETGGVLADAFIAGVAERWMGVVDLLHHGSDKARELGQVAAEERFAEVDVAEEPVEWVGEEVVGGGGEEVSGGEAPVLGCLEGEVFFAFEVMEEAAFGEFGGFADVFDARCGVAFGSDDLEGGVEELCFGVVFGVGHFRTYWLVWKCTLRSKGTSKAFVTKFLMTTKTTSSLFVSDF
jgi:hypothetical protein